MFSWTNKNKLDLLDSLKCGYPIGSILFWQPDTNKKHIAAEKIGPFSVPPKKDNFFYILDGFQRLSTILGCLINPQKSSLPYDEKKWKKEFLIYYDLEMEEFFLPRSENVESHQIPVYQLLDTRAAFLFERELAKKEYKENDIEKYIDRYTELGTTLIDYSLPSIDMIGGEIEEVVDVFSRVNSKGSDISPDWMASALTYNSDQGFRLGTEIDNLLEYLKIYNFSEIKRELILQCITNSFGKVYFDQSKIELLIKQQKDNFIKVAKESIESIKNAVQFLFEELLVIDGKLLPYGIQLIFITDFFNQIKKPTEIQLKKLRKWFWITTYAGYFTMYSLSKQREAYYQFQRFLKDENENLVYNDRPDSSFESPEFPNKIFFGSVRAKALILFMLNYANNFQKVNSQEIEGLKLSYLFYDMKDDKGDFYPESAVAILDKLQSVFPKSKDMSFMLESEKNYEQYFITSEMNDIYKNKYTAFQRNILDKRKNIIINAEKEFVENLGINYSDNG
ncbi:MAG: DUF262 domain-containing protein [Bacteriovorax sp.]|nr:DUF262 domain-containing protein [Bacteriovorax sp.]